MSPRSDQPVPEPTFADWLRSDLHSLTRATSAIQRSIFTILGYRIDVHWRPTRAV